MMRKIKETRRLPKVFLAVLTAAVFAASAGSAGSEKLDDQKVTDAVEDALQLDLAVQLSGIEVIVTDGTDRQCPAPEAGGEDRPNGQGRARRGA